MNDKRRLSRMELRLEQWIEHAFATAFGARTDVFDLALHLARSMETGLIQPGQPGQRPLAPDTYQIYIHPDELDDLRQRQDGLDERLTRYVLSLASQNEYRLTRTPCVSLHADADCDPRHPRTVALHSEDGHDSTKGMQAVRIPQAPPPTNPNLMVTGSGAFALTIDVVNIGRMSDNDLILDDPTVSRHHAQLRRRGSEYLLFDLGSSRGTRVNGALIREHRLRSGDVIEIGRARLVYMDDNDSDNAPRKPPPTETFDAV